MPSTALHYYLLEQLDSLSDENRRDGGVRMLITFVDENGYLSESLVSIAETTGERVADLERSLKVLQKLRPIGVGARHLQECLRLQANAQFPPRHAIYTLIEHHLLDIEHRRLTLISERTGIDEDTIKEAVGLLRNFDPKPGQSISRRK